MNYQLFKVNIVDFQNQHLISFPSDWRHREFAPVLFDYKVTIILKSIRRVNQIPKVRLKLLSESRQNCKSNVEAASAEMILSNSKNRLDWVYPKVNCSWEPRDFFFAYEWTDRLTIAVVDMSHSWSYSIKKEPWITKKLTRAGRTNVWSAFFLFKTLTGLFSVYSKYRRKFKKTTKMGKSVINSLSIQHCCSNHLCL